MRLILIGLARCIAMEIVRSDFAEKSSEYGAELLALNSISQLFAYSLYTWIFITVLLPYFGFDSAIVTNALGLEHNKSVAVAFTAVGNNFELSIAVFGLNLKQSFAGLIGTMVEVQRS